MQKKVEEEQDVANSLKEFVKRWPKFYYFIFDFFGPVYFGGVGPKEFIKKYPNKGKCYVLGSGTRRLFPETINIDVKAYPDVDIVADITNLPINTGEAPSVICDQALEHVRNPEKAVSEVERILIKGGYAYVSTPFLYPYHASPNDYQRWTHMGLRELFSNFEIVEVGVRCGPFSTFTVYCCYFFATLFSFGSKKLYWTLVYASTFLFFPIKFLDVIGNRLPQSINMAGVLYCVVRKK